MKSFRWEYINYFLIPLLILDGLFRERSSLFGAVLLLLSMILLPTSINVYKSATRRRKQENEAFYRSVVYPLNQWKNHKDPWRDPHQPTIEEIQRRLKEDNE